MANKKFEVNFEKTFHLNVDVEANDKDEAQDKAEDYLGDELWQMAVESGNTDMGKKEWIEWVISQDGYGQTLNHYDGTEYYDEDNKVYIMRC